ncbi:MAG: peroxiredoxin family protein [Prevotella sp.]
MKKAFIGVLSFCLATAAFAQKASTEKAYQRVEAAFSQTADVESLRDNAQFMKDLKEVVTSATQLTAKVVADHSTFIFMNGMLDDVGVALGKMPKEVKESEEGKKTEKLYLSIRPINDGVKLPPIDIGSEAPDFTLPTPDGKQINLKEFLKGKKCVLLDFWASWCGWCRKENPNVLAAYDEFKDKGFDVLSVSLDTKEEAWRKALNEDKPTWPQVVDYRGTKDGLHKLYTLNGIPAIFLIGSDGIIVAKKLRGGNIRKAVVEYLEKH